MLFLNGAGGGENIACSSLLMRNLLVPMTTLVKNIVLLLIDSHIANSYVVNQW